MGIAGLLLRMPDLIRSSGARQAATGAPTKRRLARCFADLARKPGFWLLAFAAASSSLCGYGLAAVDAVGTRCGASGWRWSTRPVPRLARPDRRTAGRVAGGWLADRLGAARPPLVRAASGDRLADHRAGLRLRGCWCPACGSRGCCSLIPNALQHPVARAGQRPPSSTSCRGRMRATASASFLLINNLIGLGIGPFLIGALPTRSSRPTASDALRYAVVGVIGLLSAGGGC